LQRLRFRNGAMGRPVHFIYPFPSLIPLANNLGF